jgi:hypothetical protein
LDAAFDGLEEGGGQEPVFEVYVCEGIGGCKVWVCRDGGGEVSVAAAET